MVLTFLYSADKQYFADLLADGDISRLEDRFSDLFDFRDPLLKRREFNSQRKNLLEILNKRSGGMCEICRDANGVEIDHRIPLSSNLLNKELRKMRGSLVNGKRLKAPSVSYGSNNVANLQLLCKECNRKKWHRFFPV